MGPDLVLKKSEINTEASGSKEIAGIMDEQNDRHTRCTSNCQDSTFEMEAAKDEEDGRSYDVEVDILHCTNPGDVGLLESPCQDVTENSSSFADSVSGDQDAMRLNEAEVQSEFRCDASSMLPFDEYSEIFRISKKRLTPHWRTFIRPITWRCKWLELQIKKFQAEAMKYDREIAACNKKKQLEAEKCTLEGFSAKSIPYSPQRKEVMKRKKRKRTEETADIASYMGHHNLFSYYERSAHNASLLTNNLGNQGKLVDGNGGTEVHDELLSHEFRESQNLLELILGKIEMVHSKVSTMKTRLNKITSEHAESIFASNRLSAAAPCNALASAAINPVSPSNSGNRISLEPSYAAAQLITKDSLSDLVMSESVAPTAGIVNNTDKTKVASPVHVISLSLSHANTSDFVKRSNELEEHITCCTLPSFPGTLTLKQLLLTMCKLLQIADAILIYSRRAKQEVGDGIESVNVQPSERSVVVKAEQYSSSTPPSHPGEADLLTDDQPAPKIRSISNLTATKNRRKGSGRRSVSARSKA